MRTVRVQLCRAFVFKPTFGVWCVSAGSRAFEGSWSTVNRDRAAPFEGALEGGVGSVMGSYNLIQTVTALGNTTCEPNWARSLISVRIPVGPHLQTARCSPYISPCAQDSRAVAAEQRELEL